eukprot:scaffold153799_cov29-Tisochrysis_lutea.AAC.4
MAEQGVQAELCAESANEFPLLNSGGHRFSYGANQHVIGDNAACVCEGLAESFAGQRHCRAVRGAQHDPTAEPQRERQQQSKATPACLTCPHQSAVYQAHELAQSLHSKGVVRPQGRGRTQVKGMPAERVRDEGSRVSAAVASIRSSSWCISGAGSVSTLAYWPGISTRGCCESRRRQQDDSKCAVFGRDASSAAKPERMVSNRTRSSDKEDIGAETQSRRVKPQPAASARASAEEARAAAPEEKPKWRSSALSESSTGVGIESGGEGVTLSARLITSWIAASRRSVSVGRSDPSKASHSASSCADKRGCSARRTDRMRDGEAAAGTPARTADPGASDLAPMGVGAAPAPLSCLMTDDVRVGFDAKGGGPAEAGVALAVAAAPTEGAAASGLCSGGGFQRSGGEAEPTPDEAM